MVRFQIVWPAWMEEVTKRAASDHTMATSVYVRQAVLEKLERDGYKRGDR